MNLKEQNMNYKKITPLEPEDEKIQETINISKQVFYKIEQERMLTYHEFLWSQFKVIRKRWWLIQFLLLCIFVIINELSYEGIYNQRSMGVTATMFIILIIPEFWKNRTYHCMEIEEVSYYSLRQIYAARMLLFGIVDVLLLTVFCTTMTMQMHVEFTRVLVDFLLPMLITACICFGTLCSKRFLNESVAVFLCILWCAVWLKITLTEKIYSMITLPVWIVCIVLSLIFFGITIYRTLNNKYWEVVIDETGVE